jgi:hypothetical protein
VVLKVCFFGTGDQHQNCVGSAVWTN